MSEPKVIMLKACKHCGSLLRVESCGTYCPNYANNNPAKWREDDEKVRRRTVMELN